MHILRNITVLFLLLLSSTVTEKIVQAAPPAIQPLANNPACSIYNKSPQAKESITWTGACKNGLTHGKGTGQWVYYRLGERKIDTYVGEMEAGKRHGRGKILWSGGSSYDGDWKNGVRHGNGLYTWPGANKYKGEFKNNKRHGQGIMVFNGGSKYKGTWAKSKKHGQGIFVYRNGNQLHGEFRNDKPFAVKCYIKAENIWKNGVC
jgi:hypothetical protein